MKYAQVIGAISGETKEVKKLSNSLTGGTKNQLIRMLRDYYDGNQWGKSYPTVQSRSGKDMWSVKEPAQVKTMGLKAGELKIWNVCDSSIDIYSSYTRGKISDHNRIQMKEKPKVAEQLNKKLKLDELVMRVTNRMSVESVTVLKYGEGGYINFIDTLEYFPVYLEDVKVGSVRTYKTDANDEIVKELIKTGKLPKDTQECVYTEIYVPELKKDGTFGDMWLYRFIDDVQYAGAKSTLPFDPYILVINKKSEWRNFDEKSIEISDVDKLIDVQDDLNSTVTDTSSVLRKVAMPMLKIVKEVWEKMVSGDLDSEAVKAELEKLTLVAGSIINAPVDAVDGGSFPDTIMDFIKGIYEQVYRVTGIPSFVFVSDVANISEKTSSNLMESLNRRIDEKRTNIETAIKEIVAMYLYDVEKIKELGQIETIKDGTSVTWAENFGMSKAELSTELDRHYKNNVLPLPYVLQKVVTLFGDGEILKKIEGYKAQEDPNYNLVMEGETLEEKDTTTTDNKSKDSTKGAQDTVDESKTE